MTMKHSGLLPSEEIYPAQPSACTVFLLSKSGALLVFLVPFFAFLRPEPHSFPS